MLMVLGIDSRKVYEEDFETPFLKQSADFYRVNKPHPLTQCAHTHHYINFLIPPLILIIVNSWYIYYIPTHIHTHTQSYSLLLNTSPAEICRSSYTYNSHNGCTISRLLHVVTLPRLCCKSISFSQTHPHTHTPTYTHTYIHTHTYFIDFVYVTHNAIGVKLSDSCILLHI